MTPISCSVIVRAFVSPALVNDPALLLLWTTVRAFVGPALVHDPPFSAFRRHSYTRFSNSPRNNTGVVFFHWFRPDWCTINMYEVLLGGRHFALFFGCHALHKPSPHVLGVHVLSRMFLLYFVYLLPTVVALR